VLYQIPLELLRFLIVFIIQGGIIFTILYLAIQILLRVRDRTKTSLALFYILLVVGLVFNILFVLISSTGEAYLIKIVYILASYFIVFPFIFIIIFINTLLKMTDKFTLKSIVIIVVIYGVLCGLLYLIPQGITFTPDWNPIYSPVFGSIASIFFTGTITIPTIVYSYRLYKIFKAPNLRRRLRLLLIGIFLIIFSIYGAIFFNTALQTSIKSAYALIAIIIEFIAALLIYLGFGREL
jgi:hypothetical protein